MRLWLSITALLTPTLAMAQDAIQEIPVQDFLSQVLAAIHGFGGLPMVAKIAAVITIIIASMKVSFLKQLIWSKLGKAQASLPIFLGLIGGLLSAGLDGHLPTLPQALAWMASGAGAIIMHEILDMIKAIPKIGPLWVAVINIIESNLGGKK